MPKYNVVVLACADRYSQVCYSGASKDKANKRFNTWTNISIGELKHNRPEDASSVHLFENGKLIRTYVPEIASCELR